MVKPVHSNPANPNHNLKQEAEEVKHARKFYDFRETTHKATDHVWMYGHKIVDSSKNYIKLFKSLVK